MMSFWIDRGRLTGGLTPRRSPHRPSSPGTCNREFMQNTHFDNPGQTILWSQPDLRLYRALLVSSRPKSLVWL
jgi:hypothetical protein